MSSLEPSAEHKTPKHETKLSTSSPKALRVAAEITPTRLANLLIRKGPLAIRLITAQLSVEVPGFELLSLLKQRRLIMAAMEQEDPTNKVVFEKIGWGQWAVRRLDSDYIVTDNNSTYPRVCVLELREKAKLGWLKKIDADSAAADGSSLQGSAGASHSAARSQKPASRRDSITNSKKNLHNTKLPGENLELKNGAFESELDSDQSDDDPMSDDKENNAVRDARRLGTVMALGNTHSAAEIDDNAIAEDLDEPDEDALFKFEHDECAPGSTKIKFKRSPPVKFANRVPTRFSPPPALSGTHRKLSLAATNGVFKNTPFTASTRQTIFSRSRLNSLENLDNYIVSSARQSSASVSSPASVTHPNSGTSSSPLESWGSKADMLHELHMSQEHFSSAFGRRKLSFNESSIRSTLSNSLPRANAGARGREGGSPGPLLSLLAALSDEMAVDGADGADGASDTDEEDWAAMGAETLRKNTTGLSSPAGNRLKNEERTAARALVDLMGT